MWYLLAAALLFGIAKGAHHTNIMCCGTAHYKITFTTTWSEAAHGTDNSPANRHFSPITAASHSDDYEMWRPMKMASDGVKYVAEKADNTMLKAELNEEKMKGNVHQIFVADGPTDPETSDDTTMMYFTPEHHYGSMISMTAPSPDWFIGIYNLDLCGSDTGKWMKRRSLNLYSWDAGTDSGKNFTSPDEPTVPQDYIKLLEPGTDMYSSYFNMAEVPKYATILFELQNVTGCGKKPCMAMSSENYYIKFQGMWNNVSHPTDFPADAHFSPLVGAGHSMHYTMWAPGGNATPGVQVVAETGAPTTLVSELEVAYGVLSHAAFSGPILSTENMQVQVGVDQTHPYISAITMIFPSPDWFVGASSIDVCDGYFWKDGPITLSLPPWDAGTDSGLTFAAANDPTDPHMPISLITTDTMGSFYNRHRQHIPRLGTITLERMIDAQRDYRNLVTKWKMAFSDFQMEFDDWKNDECPGGN